MPGAGLKCFVYAFCLGAGTNAAFSACTEMGQGSIFDEATKDLDKRKMIQVSMDGPNVNWKLLSSIVDERQSNDDYPELLDIGSCSLHVIHGAF